MTKLTSAVLVTSILSVGLFSIAGCNDSQSSDPGDTVAAPPQKSKRALRAERFAGVTDPVALVEGWKEELLETGFFQLDDDGNLSTDQFSFRYTWRFDGPNAEFTVEHIDGPNGEPLPGTDVLHEFVTDMRAFWAGDKETPRFIRALDGENGDRAIDELQAKIIEGALQRANEDNDRNAAAALASRPSLAESTAYEVLVNSGAEFETEATGNVFDFRATAKFREDGKVEGHFYVTGKESAAETPEPAEEETEDVNE